MQCFQESGRVNLILPGSFLPLKKEISYIFRIEKARFTANQHFLKISSPIDFQPVYTNKANLKKTYCQHKSWLKIKSKEFEIISSNTTHAR